MTGRHGGADVMGGRPWRNTGGTQPSTSKGEKGPPCQHLLSGPGPQTWGEMRFCCLTPVGGTWPASSGTQPQWEIRSRAERFCGTTPRSPALLSCEGGTARASQGRGGGGGRRWARWEVSLQQCLNAWIQTSDFCLPVHGPAQTSGCGWQVAEVAEMQVLLRDPSPKSEGLSIRHWASVSLNE